MLFTDGVTPLADTLRHFSDKCVNHTHVGRCDDESCEDGSHFKPCLKTAKKWLLITGGDFIQDGIECWSLCGRCSTKKIYPKRDGDEWFEFSSLKDAKAGEIVHAVIKS